MLTVHGVSEPEQTTIFGVLVHLIGLLFGIVGAGLVYLLSSSEYTKSNAKNALNWQIFFLLGIILLSAVTFGIGSVSDIIGIIGTLGLILFILSDLMFCLWATKKAVNSSAWNYPLAPEFI